MCGFKAKKQISFIKISLDENYVAVYMSVFTYEKISEVINPVL